MHIVLLINISNLLNRCFHPKSIDKSSEFIDKDKLFKDIWIINHQDFINGGVC